MSRSSELGGEEGRGGERERDANLMQMGGRLRVKGGVVERTPVADERHGQNSRTVTVSRPCHPRPSALASTAPQ